MSGLSQADATTLATALETARVNWWRRAVAARIETLRSVHERVVLLAEPRPFIARSVFRDLEREARDVAGEMASRWPDSLSTAPEFRMLKAIRALVKDPEPFRARANAAFVGSELSRSREFLDRVEARPLTDVQCRAVVVDEDRNLVVAACPTPSSLALPCESISRRVRAGSQDAGITSTSRHPGPAMPMRNRIASTTLPEFAVHRVL